MILFNFFLSPLPHFLLANGFSFSFSFSFFLCNVDEKEERARVRPHNTSENIVLCVSSVCVLCVDRASFVGGVCTSKRIMRTRSEQREASVSLQNFIDDD